MIQRRALAGWRPPGEWGQVRLDPAGSGLRTGQGDRTVVAGEQALAEQRRAAAGERGEVLAAALRRVVADELDPGPADRRVVLLRRPRIPGGPLNAVADQADRRSHAEPSHGEPGQVHVLAMAEAAGCRHHLGHQVVELTVA